MRLSRLYLLLAVVAGGGLGSVARAVLVEALPFDGESWPWATFLANVCGTLILGFGVTRLQERLPPSTDRGPFMAAGLAGALTTFSALQVEALELVHNGHAAMAASYVGVSVVAGLLCISVTTALVRRASIT